MATKKTAKTATSKSANTAAKEKSVSELSSALAERTGLTKAKAKEFLDAHAELLIEELKQQGSVQLAGIGKLKMGERPDRQGRNPATGEPIKIAAKTTVKFRVGKAMKDAIGSK